MKKPNKPEMTAKELFALVQEYNSMRTQSELLYDEYHATLKHEGHLRDLAQTADENARLCLIAANRAWFAKTRRQHVREAIDKERTAVRHREAAVKVREEIDVKLNKWREHSAAKAKALAAIPKEFRSMLNVGC